MTYHVGVIIGAYAGRLLQEDGIPQIHAFLDHVTGQRLLTHQLPDAILATRPFLLEKFPWLSEYDDALFNELRGDRDAIEALVSEAVERHGYHHDVPRMTDCAPIGHEILAGKEVLAVALDDDLDEPLAPRTCDPNGKECTSCE